MIGEHWTAQFDNYCERTDLLYWSEPINAVTNAAFVIAAIWMWRRCAALPMAKVLCVILFLIGIGSYLFHTHATRWAATADVLPIGLFILTYLFLASRDFLGLPNWAAALATAGFVPYAYVLVPILDGIPFLKISNFYWTVPLLLLVYAIPVWRRSAQTARGMIYGALLLAVSITIRSMDESLCQRWPIGTHFMWHVLNACMLAWMIEVYRRHRQTRPR